ncbi:MAG: hypothetical protein HPY58_10110 [Firmicutes bacterium]|nr:hypothetical protein [Bacillota bacterium]
MMRHMIPAREVPREMFFTPHDAKYGWVVLDTTNGRGYGKAQLVTRYVNEDAQLPDVLKKLRSETAAEILKSGETGVIRPWNGKRYYLKSFSITRTRDDERPRIHFEFGPSDYLNFLATSLNLDRELYVNDEKFTLRDKYLAGKDPYGKPVAFLAHSFGINLAVLTRDNYVLLVQRSVNVKSRPGLWNIAVNEGLQRPTDGDVNGNPNFYRAAIRGVYEELGVSITESDSDWPLFLSFGLDWELYQYALGRVRLNLTAKEILEIREVACKDKWESRELHPVIFSLKSLASFVREHYPWSPAGLVCLIHTLMMEEGLTIEKVMKEFAKAGIRHEVFRGSST